MSPVTPVTPLAVSFVVPHVDRSDTIVETVEELLAISAHQGWRPEVIVVCDDSPEAAWRRVVESAADHPEVTALRLDRRSWALNARAVGMLGAGGDVVVTVDDDLEIEPSHVVPLVEAIAAGADLAAAVRSPGGDRRPAPRRLGSLVIGALAAVVRNRPRDPSCGMKAFSAQHARRVVGDWPRTRDIRLGVRMYQLADRVVEVPVPWQRPVGSNHSPVTLAANMVDTSVAFVSPNRRAPTWAVLASAVIALAVPCRWTPWRLARGSLFVAGAVTAVDLVLAGRSPVPGGLERNDGRRSEWLVRVGSEFVPPGAAADPSDPLRRTGGTRT